MVRILIGCDRTRSCSARAVVSASIAMSSTGPPARSRRRSSGCAPVAARRATARYVRTRSRTLTIADIGCRARPAALRPTSRSQRSRPSVYSQPDDAAICSADSDLNVADVEVGLTHCRADGLSELQDRGSPCPRLFGPAGWQRQLRCPLIIDVYRFMHRAIRERQRRPRSTVPTVAGHRRMRRSRQCRRRSSRLFGPSVQDIKDGKIAAAKTVDALHYSLILRPSRASPPEKLTGGCPGISPPTISTRPPVEGRARTARVETTTVSHKSLSAPITDQFICGDDGTGRARYRVDGFTFDDIAIRPSKGSAAGRDHRAWCRRGSPPTPAQSRDIMEKDGPTSIGAFKIAKATKSARQNGRDAARDGDNSCRCRQM